MRLFKRIASAFMLLMSLLAWPGVAAADVGQEEACASEIARVKHVPMSQVRSTRSEGSRSGVTEIDFDFHGGSAVCMIDRDYNVLDIHYSRPPERKHNDDHQGSPVAQEQACAARMAGQVNVPMSSVRVSGARPFIMGSRQMTVTAPGMKATCTADVHNNVVFWKFVPPDY